jgi:hypothetical protein
MCRREKGVRGARDRSMGDRSTTVGQGEWGRWGTGVLRYWSTGGLGYCGTGGLEYCGAGALECWALEYTGALEYWRTETGVLRYWGKLGYWWVAGVELVGLRGAVLMG